LGLDSDADKASTMQVLIYTICHTNAARITQVHFDGVNLVFRQARLLNLASPNLRDVGRDALLLLSWMVCQPTGKTKMSGSSANLDGHCQ
jgi:hypothetical protein